MHPKTEPDTPKRKHHQSGPEWPGGINPRTTTDELRAEVIAARSYASHLEEQIKLREREARRARP